LVWSLRAEDLNVDLVGGSILHKPEWDADAGREVVVSCLLVFLQSLLDVLAWMEAVAEHKVLRLKECLGTEVSQSLVRLSGGAWLMCGLVRYGWDDKRRYACQTPRQKHMGAMAMRSFESTVTTFLLVPD